MILSGKDREEWEKTTGVCSGANPFDRIECLKALQSPDDPFHVFKANNIKNLYIATIQILNKVSETKLNNLIYLTDDEGWEKKIRRRF